ncbi:hypothetical protein BV25DRAFT_648934 [Artomyces pyxidatus]|uniref:Uncharacterized protein n=1 Tax=Artomyces pyxidatus TaxID=48021 RepID=A0ACB8SF89_9AGAM|nr:hypothetical protein BV25DRAFT_648934 [Artomyces pyxidatus]
MHGPFARHINRPCFPPGELSAPCISPLIRFTSLNPLSNMASAPSLSSNLAPSLDSTSLISKKFSTTTVPNTNSSSPPPPPSTPSRPTAFDTAKQLATPAPDLRTPPASPASPALADRVPVLAIRAPETRQRLIDTGLYLGNGFVRDGVMWARDGKANRLILKPAPGEPVDEAGMPIGEFTLAPLSMVAVISSSDYYLTSDGGYRGPSIYCGSFAEIKPSCALQKLYAPADVRFDEDYAEALKTLEWLQGAAATQGLAKRGLFMPSDDGRIKVRHVLFEPISSDDSSEDDADANVPSSLQVSRDPLGAEFTIAKWPTNSEVVRGELKEMKDTYDVIPIPAYDMYGDLISPKLYRIRLEGALVEVHFNLTHWSIGGRRGSATPAADTYTADLVSMRVIVPPKPRPVTPRKRKVSSMDPMAAASPTKKCRVFPRGMVGVC